MSKQYGCRPSSVLNIDDEYTAFCFDEACACLLSHLQAGEKPAYKDGIGKTVNKEYSSFSDFYKNLGG